MNDFQFVDGTRLISVLEALVFSSPDPISWDHLAGIIQESEPELALDREMVEAMVSQLNRRYEENDLSFRIKETGGGYTFATQPRYHSWLSIFQHENAYRKLSQPAIETLAIVAYRQPVTKPEIDQIRGVDSGYILRQLLEKLLIRVSGRADSPGKPLIYKTTDHFLKHFGLNSVDELPRPREIDEILKDDDMADHRRLLMERQMELDEEDAEEIMDRFLDKSELDPDEPDEDDSKEIVEDKSALEEWDTEGGAAEEREDGPQNRSGEASDRRPGPDHSGPGNEGSVSDGLENVRSEKEDIENEGPEKEPDSNSSRKPGKRPEGQGPEES